MKFFQITLFLLMAFILTACATTSRTATGQPYSLHWNPSTDFAARMPSQIDTKEKVIVVDPSIHTWGAYNSNGELIRAGIATSGDNWCDDTQRPCYTSIGSFRIRSLGGEGCKSSIYPKPNGGGLMPYCMFFHGSMSLHGSPDYLLAEDNVSHGCVRMRIEDAEWVRYNFASIGTKVIIKPYQ